MYQDSHPLSKGIQRYRSDKIVANEVLQDCNGLVAVGHQCRAKEEYHCDRLRTFKVNEYIIYKINELNKLRCIIHIYMKNKHSYKKKEKKRRETENNIYVCIDC